MRACIYSVFQSLPLPRLLGSLSALILGEAPADDKMFLEKHFHRVVVFVAIATTVVTVVGIAHSKHVHKLPMEKERLRARSHISVLECVRKAKKIVIRRNIDEIGNINSKNPVNVISDFQE